MLNVDVFNLCVLMVCALHVVASHRAVFNLIASNIFVFTCKLLNLNVLDRAGLMLVVCVC